MLKLELKFQDEYGFTLIEVVVGLAIISILIVTLYTSLSYTSKVSQNSLDRDELLLNGRYALEYIKENIGSADKIIASPCFEGLDTTFPSNIGFVILNISLNEKNDEYSYTTYYFKNDSIVRINAKVYMAKNIILDTDKLKTSLPKAEDFSGYNAIGYDILRESSIVLNENDLISLSLSLKKENTVILNFKSDIFPRCPVVK